MAENLNIGKTSGTLQFGYDVFGDDQLNALFSQLRDSQRSSIIITAWKKAASPMLSAMKSNLSSTHKKVSGNLYKSLGWKKLGRDGMTLGVGARKYGSFAGFHAHLVEYGTDERITKKGKSTGRISITKQWFNPAIDQTKKQIVDDFKDTRITALANFVKKANQKSKK